MEYKNLDLEVFDYQDVNGTRSFKVRVERSPAGEQKIHEAVPVSLPGNLDSRLRSLERRNLDQQEIIELGRGLAETLFPAGVRSFLTDSLTAVVATEDRLRIRLRLDAFALADIPWEYVYVPQPGIPEEQWGPEGFLALNARVSLVRYETMKGLLGSLTPTGLGPLRIAILLADPNKPPDYPHLKLDAEQERIERALVKVKDVSQAFYPDATIDELEDACESHVLHFAGHGKFETDQAPVFRTVEGKGFLVLLDENKDPYPYPVEKLRVTLRGTQVRLAVLGACETGRRDQINAWTGIAPALARVGIPAVIGMQYKIRDKNAIHFSWRFYRALAEKKPVDQAVTLGRQAIFNRCAEDERDWGVPVLYLRTDAAEDGRLFPVLPGASTGLPTTPLTGEVTVSPTGMLAGAPALGGPAGPSASGPLSPVLCLKPGCGAHVTGKFCHQCGTQVRCLRCSDPLPANASFCSNCGLEVPG
jgi:hypothetical protein